MYRPVRQATPVVAMPTFHDNIYLFRMQIQQ